LPERKEDVRSYTGCVEVKVDDIFRSRIRIFPNLCLFGLIWVTAVPGYKTIHVPILKYILSLIPLCYVLLVL